MRFSSDFIGRSITVRNCLECELGNHWILSPGRLIYEDAFISVHPHTFINMVGFIVISPKRHVKDASELNHDEQIRIEEAVRVAQEGLIKLKYAESTVVSYKEGEHLQYWVIGKYAPILEDNFDLSIFRDEKTMARHGLKYVKGNEIMKMTVEMRKAFKEDFKLPEEEFQKAE